MKNLKKKIIFTIGKSSKLRLMQTIFFLGHFAKNDKIRYFELACTSCNEKKSNKLLSDDYLFSIKKRSRKLRTINNFIIQTDIKSYSEDTLDTM